MQSEREVISSGYSEGQVELFNAFCEAYAETKRGDFTYDEMKKARGTVKVLAEMCINHDLLEEICLVRDSFK